MKCVLTGILLLSSLSSFASFDCSTAEKAMKNLAISIQNTQDEDIRLLSEMNLSKIQTKYLEVCVEDEQEKKTSCNTLEIALKKLALEYQRAQDADIKELIKIQIQKLQLNYLDQCVEN